MKRVYNSISKKALAVLIMFMMTITILMPSNFTASVYAKGTSATSKISVSNNLISITEARNINVSAKFGYNVDTKNLVWTFGGKNFSQWKSWDDNKKDFVGKPFIAFSKSPVINGGNVTAIVKFGLPFGVSDLNPRSIRFEFPRLTGNYNLQIKDKSTGKIASVQMKVNAYDSYHTYSEFKTTLDKIAKNVKSGRYFEITSLGKASDGVSEQYFAVVAKDKKSVDDYLNKQVPEMYNNPGELQKKLNDKNYKDYKSVVWFNNVHPDEAVGPDAILKLANDFATKDEIKFDSNKGPRDDFAEFKTLKVNEVLDNVILVFNLTQNPYGRQINRRENYNGFDLNRDYTYQTQVEDQNFAAGVNKWAPLSLLDYHGFYTQFLIEPCTGPHNANYEYDILIDGLTGQANAMGKAGVANTKYLSYDIPYFDYKDGFDDAAPCYTSMYALFQGALSHTVEVPEINQSSVDALVYAGYGSVNYLMEHRVKLAYNQLEMYKRGVENVDNKEVDRFLVDADGYIKGRQRGENLNYFPDYYAIPMVKDMQKNTSEANKMIEHLLRNGIKVQKSTDSIKVNDVTYPQGTYIIPMHQAKRGFVNAILSKGTDESQWLSMYAEIVNAFPNVRGFNCNEIRALGVFDKNVENVTSVTTLKTVIKEEASMYVVKNSSNEAIKAVNDLLKNGKKVKMVTAASEGYKVGDYIVSKTDVETIKDNYDLDVVKAAGEPTTKELNRPKIFVPMGSDLYYKGEKMEQTGFVLRELGFDVVDNIKKADMIVDSVGEEYTDGDVKTFINSGKPYIGIGSGGLGFVKDSKVINDFDFEHRKNEDSWQEYEGLLKSVMTQDNIITGGYNAEEELYTSAGSWISKYPSDAKVIAKVSDKDDFYVSGWWPKHEEVKGQVMAVQYKNMILFANNITNKAHITNEYRLLSNSIFSFGLK